MDMLKNLGSSAKGMIMDGGGSKAVIYIPNPQIYVPGETSEDQEKDYNRKVKKFESQLVKKASGKGGAAQEALNDAAEKKLDIKKSLVNAAKSVGSYLAPGQASKIGEVYGEDETFFKITVQFNPASIKMDSLNGPMQTMNATGNGGINLVNKQEFKGRTKLSFDLIFDDVDLMDAFMLQEVVDMNLSKVANKALDMYKHSGNTFSVRARMEVFMGLIASGVTQHVIFAWGKMVFRGQVTSVNNHYTMFNTRGNPIRGTMHLEITQDSKRNTKYNYKNKGWKESFEQTFEEGRGGGRSMASKILNNNILNI